MSETKELLSVQTWRALDPYAGRLSRRDRRRVAAAVVAALLAVVLGVVSWRVGYPHPKLSQDGTWGGGADPGARTFSNDFTVVNSGPHTERIVSVGRNGPGLQLVSTGVTLPIDLPPGGQQRFDLTYRVTACDVAPTERWPVPVRVERFWGRATAWLDLPTQSPTTDAAGEGFVESTEEVQWQQWGADWVCHPDRNASPDTTDSGDTGDSQDTGVTSDSQDTGVTSDSQDTGVTSDSQDTGVTSDSQDTGDTGETGQPGEGTVVAPVG